MKILDLKKRSTNSKIGNRKSKISFTLIELLVVVAIIAVLVAILLPALAKAREQTRKTLCAGNLRQIGFGYQAYANDYRGKLPPNWDPAKPNPDWYHWSEYSEPYLGKVDGLWVCPSNPWKSAQVYAINFPLSCYSDIRGNVFDTMLVSQTMLFADSPNGWKNISYTWGAPPYPDYTVGGIHLRHVARANALMLDGHVEARSEGEIPYGGTFWLGGLD